MNNPSSQDRGDSSSPARFRVKVPGRTEVAGNHQDHQGGCVIASAINRCITCEVEERAGSVITVRSHGYDDIVLDFSRSNFWTQRKDERYTTAALVRGMAAQLMQFGVELKGCTLDMRSDIPVGAGLSSSAAFELCVGAALLAIAGWTIVDEENGMSAVQMHDAKRATPLHLAQMALHAERAFFGKPSGIMDQIACAYGGVVYIDFRNRINPDVRRIAMPPSTDDYTYLLVDCGSGHEDATDSFARVAEDMQAAADAFGYAQLRDISMDEYIANIGTVRAKCGDLVAVRGLAFFEELALVEQRAAALERDDAASFVRLSGRSSVISAEYLQNVACLGEHEDAMLALALCRLVIAQAGEPGMPPRGSARIHGGGIGGTIQVLVPNEDVGFFMRRIDELLGQGSCMLVRLGSPGIRVEAL